MRELIEQGLENGSPTGKRPRTAGRSVQVNLAESPLSWLRARDLIDARQYAAGERLRADYETASLAPCVTMRWEASPIGSGRRGAPDSIDPTLAQIAAKRRFDAAVAAAGPGLSDILWRVVCAGERLPDAEKALGWPARAGRLVLTLALDRLAAQYHLG
ncbi:DUF6456 domain-containing protein [Sphingomonas sp. S1-29]|uniref:DUF6456 domain-containing protein n=1 Tax=Sphingomonas sp. S1-29 TaxID=2991074 RepID=UPI00223EDA31|nr:DUF6456 domain-containing protein [Sphingomonas sp. S1-29]UZK68084.1 DUF6456 domain-containing protein [Sphingomonas sp. S1-29]